jgi:hypothetical protein
VPNRGIGTLPSAQSRELFLGPCLFSFSTRFSARDCVLNAVDSEET